jgi:hypothetical protein
MTSSSRRKPRTTRPSTRSRSDLPRGGPAACRILVLCALAAAAARAEDWREFLRAPDVTLSAVATVLVDAEPVPQPAVSAVGPAADAPETDAAPDEAVEPVSAAEADDASAAEPSRKSPCAEEADDCRDALERLRADRLADIDLDIRVSGRPGNDYPCECRLEGETFQPRRFAATTFTWKAAGYCHKPLYFEDWELERYGHSYGALDPILSTAHFFITLPVLPYKMGVELPWECVYPLGYYRPGSCAPWTVPAIPISCRGIALEAATVTGLVFLLP